MISKLCHHIVAEVFEFLKIPKLRSNNFLQRTPVKIPFVLPQRKNEFVVIGKKEMRYTILSKEHDHRAYGDVQVITTGHWSEIMRMAMRLVSRKCFMKKLSNSKVLFLGFHYGMVG